MSTCRFPTQWNLSKVTPVFKKDNPSSENNYRSISLISVLDKVLERYVYKHIYILFTGFTPGDSAINQLLNLTNEFGKALGEGK